MDLLEVEIGTPIWGISGGEQILGVLKGDEIQISSGTVANWLKGVTPYVKTGELMGLWSGVFDNQGREIRNPVTPELPTFSEVYKKVHGKEPSGMAWEAYKIQELPRTFDKLMLFPSKTPQNLVDIIWEAAERMAKDPEVQKNLVKVAGDSPLRNGSETEKTYSDVLTGKKDVIDWLKGFLSEKYGVVF